MKYRPELDGLRAFAIIPVLLFHFGVTSLSGGYLGVDIFFVISGYLITSIIAKEIENENFSIELFYVKRIKRILPALFTVLFLTYMISFLILSPNQFKNVSQELVATATFSSNFYYMLTQNYFSSSAEETILLHTWSLAVEEQFYIFFPLVLVFFKKKKHLIITIITLMLLSFLCAVNMALNDSTVNFFFTPSRIWELLVGALIAINYKRLYQLGFDLRNALSMLGAIIVLLSLFMFDKSTLHPSWPTLLPILGIVLIIAFSSGTMLGNFISKPYLKFIGLISYSLYLWHQPIMAFITIKLHGLPKLMVFSLALTVTWVFSYLTYRFVESPFRTKQIYSNRSLFLLALVILLSFTLVGLAGHFSNGAPSRLNSTLNYESQSVSPFRYQCHTSGKNYLPPEKSCLLGEGKEKWSVFGDSHGVELAHSLSLKLKEKSSVRQLTFSDCSPLLNSNTGCEAWLNESLDFLRNNRQIEHVIVSFRHSYHLNKLNNNRSQKEYWNNVYKIINTLIVSNKEVYFLLPIPELNQHIDKLLVPSSILNVPNRPIVGETINTFYRRNETIFKKVLNIQKLLPIKLLTPSKSLCDDKLCYGTNSHQIFYFDDNHLSTSGASFILEKLDIGSKLVSKNK